jgi:F-type H+-transporting ATPase subunit beta
MPIRHERLRRCFNSVIGDAIDGFRRFTKNRRKQYMPIHRQAPRFEDLSSSEVYLQYQSNRFNWTIYSKGGKIMDCSVGCWVGKTVMLRSWLALCTGHSGLSVFAEVEQTREGSLTYFVDVGVRNYQIRRKFMHSMGKWRMGFI